MVARVTNGVVRDDAGCHVAYQFLLLKLVERKTIASLGVVVVLLDIGNGTLAHL